MNKPIRCVGYCRVSGESQAADDRDGLTRQRLACSEAAKALGYKIDEWFEDHGVSGTKSWTDRPAFSAMRQKLRPADIVIVENLDRVARDAMQALIIYDDFKRQGFRLFTTSREELFNDPTSKLMRTVISAMAEYQRDILTGRMRTAKDRMKAEGRRTDGWHFYGEHQDPERRNEETRGLELMISLRKRGATLEQIAEQLEAQGIRPRVAGKWPITTIGKILRRHRVVAA